MDIGITIKKLRIRKKIQQNKLAEASGISQTYLSQIESGSRSATIDTLEKICEVLDIPLSILSFLSLNVNSIAPNKRDAYLKIEPKIKRLVEELFLQDYNKS